MRGLDTGIIYSVIINVFDGNQVVLSDEVVIETVLVMNNEQGKFLYVQNYV